MKVYVVESGEYSDRWISGVYSTVEGAMRGTSEPDWKMSTFEADGSRAWRNEAVGLREVLTIWEFEVDGE